MAAVERLLSVSQVRTDDSLQYRQEESAAVLEAIRQSPLLGHGFGAGVTWRMISEGVGDTTTFAHNGYLWLVWKVGASSQW